MGEGVPDWRKPRRTPSDPIIAEEIRSGVGLAARVDLAIEVGDMPLDGANTDREAIRDFAITLTRSDLAEDLQFAAREPMGSAIGGRDGTLGVRSRQPISPGKRPYCAE